MVQEQNEFEQLDPKLIPAERLGSAIFFGVVMILGLIGWVVFALLGWGLRDYRPWATLGVGVAILGSLAWWSYRYPQLRWQTTRLKMSDRGLELHRGVYWQHKIFIPRERIQHTDITQGPVSRRFQIAELVINTAGNHNYVIKIEGLNVQRAGDLRLELLPRVRAKEPQKCETDVVVNSAEPEACSKASEIVSDTPKIDAGAHSELPASDEKPSIGVRVPTLVEPSRVSVGQSPLAHKEDEIERSH
ncbi:MAG: PH domain-containing protein [Pirellula sp.]|jgi:membrane protein YdbS with pleckstrin-like domain